MSSKKKTKKKIAHHHHHHHDEHDHHHHDHDHDHHHDDHDHGHPHEHDDRPQRDDLKKGAGKGKILFLDAPSGLAGDMIIAALVDLGVPEHVVLDAVESLPLKGFHVHFGARTKSGIVGTAFDVHVDGKQPERTWGEIEKMLEKSKLAPGVKQRAIATFLRLAESEAKVHRMSIEGVHFHEVGGIDAIVDVVGSAAALEHLGAKLVVSPLPMGHGRVKARHGILPLPAPATVECLKGHPTYEAGVAFEFVTPTGAAIVGAHSEGSARWPAMKALAVGWGAGTAELADRPNLLRAILGEPTEEGAARVDKVATHSVLEANIDDATGELVASCIDSLMAEGALDAWVTPITMKKGRPAFLLSALAPAAVADQVAAAMLTESTSLGVRRYGVDRVERPRRIVHVDTAYGSIPVKIAEGPFGPPQRKPEFDACAAAATAHGVPVREVIHAALVSASQASFQAHKSSDMLARAHVPETKRK